MMILSSGLSKEVGKAVALCHWGCPSSPSTWWCGLWVEIVLLLLFASWLKFSCLFWWACFVCCLKKRLNSCARKSISSRYLLAGSSGAVQRIILRFTLLFLKLGCGGGVLCLYLARSSSFFMKLWPLWRDHWHLLVVTLCEISLGANGIISYMWTSSSLDLWNKGIPCLVWVSGICSYTWTCVLTSLCDLLKIADLYLRPTEGIVELLWIDSISQLTHFLGAIQWPSESLDAASLLWIFFCLLCVLTMNVSAPPTSCCLVSVSAIFFTSESIGFEVRHVWPDSCSLSFVSDPGLSPVAMSTSWIFESPASLLMSFASRCCWQSLVCGGSVSLTSASWCPFVIRFWFSASKTFSLKFTSRQHLLLLSTDWYLVILVAFSNLSPLLNLSSTATEEKFDPCACVCCRSSGSQHSAALK